MFPNTGSAAGAAGWLLLVPVWAFAIALALWRITGLLPAQREGPGLVRDGNNGADVRDREINITRLLQPSRRITVRVRRDGEDRDYPLIVAQAPVEFLQRRKTSVPDAPAYLVHRVVSG